MRGALQVHHILNASAAFATVEVLEADIKYWFDLFMQPGEANNS